MELFILNNFILNLMLNFLVVKLSFLQYSIKKLVLSALLATIYTLVFIYIKKAVLLYKIFGFFLVSSTLAKYKNIYAYIKCCTVYLFVAILVSSVFNFIIYGENISIYDINFSIRLLVVYMLFILLIIMHKIVNLKIKEHKINMSFYDKAQICVNNKKLNVLTYYDSGNMMYKNFLPVCVIDKNLVDKLNLKSKDINILTARSYSSEKFVVIDKLTIKGQGKSYKNVKCLVSDNLLNCQLLLHKDMR